MARWEHISEKHSSIIALIKSERIKQGLSHEKLANKSGLSSRAIGMIEAGERKPTLYNILKICDSLNLDVNIK